MTSVSKSGPPTKRATEKVGRQKEVFGFRSYSFFDRRNEIATLQSWIMYPDWISKEGIVGNGVPVSP